MIVKLASALNMTHEDLEKEMKLTISGDFEDNYNLPIVLYHGVAFRHCDAICAILKGLTGYLEKICPTFQGRSIKLMVYSN